MYAPLWSGLIIGAIATAMDSLNTNARRRWVSTTSVGKIRGTPFFSTMVLWRSLPLPFEIQGYAYDAKVRCARLAREIWKDEAWASRLESQAADLKRRFNRDFWIPERQFFALALDGEKRKVDSLCSNMGHLLWSGIVEDDKVQAVRNHLMSPRMFSGWGIRTMAKGEGGYNPIEYHNGTVWPHDCSIIAAGLARHGFRKDASDIIAGIFEASLS